MKKSDKKLVKYISRDYKLRDRSLFYWALLEPRFVKEIYYKEGLDIMKNGLVTVYVLGEDFERMIGDIRACLLNDENYIGKILQEGVRSTSALGEISKSPIDAKITKKEALSLLYKAEDVWGRFGSFVEFTHALGRTKINLNESQLGILGKFHNKRREYFLNFFKYIESICVAVSDNGIKQKDLSLLTMSEVKKYLNGELDFEEINKKQERRAGGYIYHVLNNDFEEVVVDFNSNVAKGLLARVEEDENNRLSGEVVSGGVVRGIARVIFQNEKLAKEDLSGKIVITSMTKPTMDIFLKKSLGIVTEEGGILCHAAIFARENKIPVITNVSDATKLIGDGDLVEVDADNGLVKIIKKAKQ